MKMIIDSEHLEKYRIGGTLDYIKGYIDGIEFAKTCCEPFWHPASEAPPEDGEYFIRADNYTDTDEWEAVFLQAWDEKVTHWAHIPDAEASIREQPTHNE